MPSERQRLLAWYRRRSRDLPWRRTRDPYAIWVSEIMLQQTRVDTVIPYFERFLARFPTPRALADADEDAVLAAWSGLGYYRRARLLHRGVREVVAHYEGLVPREREARLALPGVGAYTAGAIGSIAFSLEEPIVDGNVARVLSRLRGIAAPLGTRESERALWAEAAQLVRGPHPGDLNQALMELGALVCTPTSPRCDECPLRAACVARSDERTTELPVAKRKAKPKPVSWVAVVAVHRRSGDHVLVKEEGALFGGLWSVPMAEGTSRANALALLARHHLVGDVEPRPHARVRHVLSHRVLAVTIFRATISRLPRRGNLRRIAAASLDALGTSTLTRRVLATAHSAALERST